MTLEAICSSKFYGIKNLIIDTFCVSCQKGDEHVRKLTSNYFKRILQIPSLSLYQQHKRMTLLLQVFRKILYKERNPRCISPIYLI